VRLNSRKGDQVIELTLHELGYDSDGNPIVAGTADEQAAILARLAAIVYGRLGATAPQASGPAPSATANGLCSLVTPDEVTAVFGVAIATELKADSYDRPYCEWASPPNAEQNTFAFSINEVGPDDLVGWQQQFQYMTTLPDVGTEAYLYDEDYSVPTVFAKSPGGHWIQLYGNRESDRDNLVHFAKIAVDRADSVLGAVPQATPEPVAVGGCSLLSEQEVADVMGVEVTSANENGEYCEYSRLTAQTQSTPLALTFIRSPTEAESYQARKSSAPGGYEGYAEVPGLGDDAFKFDYPASSGNTVILVVLKGDASLELDSGEIFDGSPPQGHLLGTTDEQLDMLVQLASTALGRF
jgi:hypothetical protein